MASGKQLKLFELTGAKPECVFSPFVWRVRLAMLHKGLSYESINWYYTEKDKIKPAEKVPVLDYGEQRIFESWDIVQFLEKEFPDKPSLFKTKCASGESGIKFITKWSDDTMYMAVTKVVMLDMYNHLNPKDQPYFRESREAMFKPMKLEEVSADTPQKVEAFRKAMEPLRQTLKQFKFLGGNQLNYSDIAIAGIFLWARSISKIQLLEKEDPIYEWRERMFKIFDKTISNTFGYAV